MEGHPAPLVGAGAEAPDEQGHSDDQREDDEQSPLEELHVRGGGHARRGHDDDHHRAHHDHARGMRQAQQGLHQHAGSHHLGDQVAEGHDQGADGPHELDALGIEFGIHGIGEGVLAQALHGFGHHEQGHHPAREVPDGIQESVIAAGGDHAADTQEGSRGKIVTREGDAVHAPVNLAPGGVVAAGGLGLGAVVEGEAEDEAHECKKDDDRHVTCPLRYRWRPFPLPSSRTSGCRPRRGRRRRRSGRTRTPPPGLGPR